MIPIKINNKKYSIKSIDELTTKEYIELSKIEGIEIVRYVAWQTNLTFEKAFFATTDKELEIAIGKTKDISKLPILPVHYLNFKKSIETVGQRYQIETSKLEGYELLVFCLAVAQAQSNNIDDVHKLINYYNTKPWRETLPAGFFFYRLYRNGKRFVDGFLMNLLDLIKTRLSKNRLE